VSELDQKVTEQLNLIEVLKRDIEGLQKKKIEIATEINKPIYEAKAQAEQIISDAQAQAKVILENANVKMAEANAYVEKKTKDADILLVAVKKNYEESKAGRDQLEKDRVDFNAGKFASETNLQQKIRDADQKLNAAVKLEKELHDRQINIDSRLSVVLKKEADLQANLEKLEQSKIETQQKIDELRISEQARADEKVEIMSLKAGNEDTLAKIKDEHSRIETDIITNQNILAEVKTEKANAVKISLDATRQLNAIADAKADLEELRKTVNEKERLQKVLARQVDEKIVTLNQIRVDNEKILAQIKESQAKTETK
jgi:hypothetical protein